MSEKEKKCNCQILLGECNTTMTMMTTDVSDGGDDDDSDYSG